MSVFHDEIEIEDFEFDEDTETFYFPCPCGDRFAISKFQLLKLWLCQQLVFVSVRSINAEETTGTGLCPLLKKEDLESGEDVASCPSCSLIVKVIYDKDLFAVGETVLAPSSSESKLELVQT